MKKITKSMPLPEFFYKLCKPFLGGLYRLYYHPTIIGKENIPKTGAIIVVGNHKHVMDQCNVIISCKRVIHYMAKKEYFDNKKTAWFFKLVGCISVNRQIKDEDAKNQAMMVLENGGAIGLFPEGTRNKTNEFLLPFKYGAVSMAQKSQASLVPFSVVGDYQFRSKNLVIRIGKPFKISKEMPLNEANEILKKRIGKLMKTH